LQHQIRGENMKAQAVINYIHQLAEKNHIQLSDDDINKILWYADTNSFLENGRSITGGTYIRGENGPVLK